MDSPNPQPKWQSGSLGWALFLGCSWTWVIGMFLPVLLVREVGFWGWVVFAIPNVVGAAAMGWVLATPRQSEALVEHHRPAALAFSYVTIAFHAFFTFWMLPRLIGPAGPAITAMLLALFYLYGRSRTWRDLFLAALVFSISAGAFIAAISLGRDSHFAPLSLPHPERLLGLLPVCLFGFLLCPYLDLTFHRARQSTGVVSARAAFGLGFGVFFFLMILFSLMYSRWLEDPSTLPRALAWIIALHMAVQIAFTLSLHLREIEHHGTSTGRGIPLRLIASASLLLPALLPLIQRQWFNLDSGEVFYRLFMGFYGLVFPAYVWTAMVPGRGQRPTNSIEWRLLLLSILPALPFFWLGFIQNSMLWLLPGVALALGPRLILHLRSPGTNPHTD